MSTDECTPKLKDQPRRIAAAGRAVTVRRAAGRFVTAAETAALLNVTRGVLLRWRVVGQGPQPVPRPQGWLYNAEEIERLAAMPYVRRTLAILRTRR